MRAVRGIDANTALRDAVALRRALRALDRGEQDLICAVGGYERFRAVRASKHGALSRRGYADTHLHQVVFPRG
jgi:2-polyprenyl-6-methoxyphenol hydroxylase-like FAD-dependent oxidoreductase